jgi:hypothetical protein
MKSRRFLTASVGFIAFSMLRYASVKDLIDPYRTKNIKKNEKVNFFASGAN